MNDALSLGSEVSPAIQQIAAQRAAEDRAVADALKIARDPAGDLGAMREALEALPRQSYVNVVDRVSDYLRQQAQRTGDFSTVERVEPHLPSAERIAAERTELAEVMTQRETALVRLLQLSPDGRLVHAALDTVFADRQPNASTEVRQDISDYAAVRLAEREDKLGPVQLPQAALGVIDMERFSTLVRGVQELSPSQDAAPVPQAVRPVTIRTGEEMAETARLLREGSPPQQPSIAEASAAAADALAAGKLRTNLEERIGASRTMAELQGLLSEERFREDRQALAGHPAQVAAIAATIEETEAKLRAQPTLELSRRGSNGPPAGAADDPAGITAAYIVRERDGERQYFQRTDGQLAIRADDTHIRGVLRDASTIAAMLDLAEARGWSDIVVRGDRDVARETWIQASLRGLAVEGFKPTRDDLHDLQQRRAGVPPPPHLGTPEANPASGHSATPAPPRRSSKQPWMDEEGGFDALTSTQQESATRSYSRWASENPELGRKHNLRDYVSYVQGQHAEEREEIKQPPPRVELPRRGLAM